MTNERTTLVAPAGETKRPGGSNGGRMSQSGLVVSRAVVRRNYAVLPPEGMATSVLPEWRDTVTRVLTAPAMGARFVQYLLEVAAGGGTQQTLREGVQLFLYVLEGETELELNGKAHRLGPGGFAYGKPGSRFSLRAAKAARLLWLKKVYVPFERLHPVDLVGDETGMKGETYMGIEGLLL